MGYTRRLLTLIIYGLVASPALLTAQVGERPVNWQGLPEPFHTPSVRNRSEVIPRPEGASLNLPDGFVVEEFADGFVRPRFMVLGPSNEILLSDSGGRQVAFQNVSTKGTGVIYVLKDGTQTPIIEGLDRPYGLALHEQWLYVAGTRSVQRFTYDTETMTVLGEGEEIIPLHDFGEGHWTRTILFNADHSALYLTVGSKSNIDLGEPAMRAAVHRYNPDGTGHVMIANGLRNPIGLRWYPETDDLWVAVQERDALGDDLVDDYVVKLDEGGFYGWPIAYLGPHVEPRHDDVDMTLVDRTLYPDVLLGAHVAVLDILFYTGEQFPQAYRGGMFLAFHGSWNRAQRTGYKIAYVPFENGRPTAGPQDFLTGWMLSEDNVQVWGRPVGLLQMPDGSLLVSDDGGRKIWRVVYRGAVSTN